MISSWDLIRALLEGSLTAWPFYLLIGIVVIVKIILRFIEKQKLSESGIDQIDSMDGKTFEKYLEVLFEKLGYRVERTQYIGDYGADLITIKDGEKTIIQAKRFKGKVNIKAIQEAVAAKGYYGCSKATVVTNSYYTKPAIELAKANNVQLWNRNDLMRALLSVKKNESKTTPIQAHNIVSSTTEMPAAANPSLDQDVCATCGKKVSEKVKQYCIANSKRFGGRVYCYEHQRTGA